MASVTEKLNFKLYFILINLNLHSHMWLVATILESSTLAYKFQDKIQDGRCHFSLVTAVFAEPSTDPSLWLELS